MFNRGGTKKWAFQRLLAMRVDKLEVHSPRVKIQSEKNAEKYVTREKSCRALLVGRTKEREQPEREPIRRPKKKRKINSSSWRGLW